MATPATDLVFLPNQTCPRGYGKSTTRSVLRVRLPCRCLFNPVSENEWSVHVNEMRRKNHQTTTAAVIASLCPQVEKWDPLLSGRSWELFILGTYIEIHFEIHLSQSQPSLKCSGPYLQPLKRKHIEPTSCPWLGCHTEPHHRRRGIDWDVCLRKTGGVKWALRKWCLYSQVIQKWICFENGCFQWIGARFIYGL